MQHPARESCRNNDENIACAFLFEQSCHPGHDGVVRAGEDAQAHAVDIFLERGIDDHLRRLSQAGVDDLHAGVAQSARDHLGAAVMAVQAGFGNKDANWWGGFRHRTEETITAGKKFAAPRPIPAGRQLSATYSQSR